MVAGQPGLSASRILAAGWLDRRPFVIGLERARSAATVLAKCHEAHCRCTCGAVVAGMSNCDSVRGVLSDKELSGLVKRLLLRSVRLTQCEGRCGTPSHPTFTCFMDN